MPRRRHVKMKSAYTRMQDPSDDALAPPWACRVTHESSVSPRCEGPMYVAGNPRADEAQMGLFRVTRSVTHTV